eukprot:2185563-Rhodomonas_salina.2
MSEGELTKPGVVGGWYLEINNQWFAPAHIIMRASRMRSARSDVRCRKGQAMGIKVKETLFEGKSDYQDVAVYETETYGKMMTLDGVGPRTCIFHRQPDVI